jgi:hypothetical protein
MYVCMYVCVSEWRGGLVYYKDPHSTVKLRSYTSRSRYNSIDVATRLPAGRPRGWGSIPNRGITSRLALGATQPSIQWVAGAAPPDIKWQEREADHSPPSSVDVKNGGAVPPLAYTSSHRGA